jgi:HK97 family phage major capsid protein
MPGKGLKVNARERLQHAAKQLQEFSDDLDKKDALTGEDIGELKNRMEEVKSLRQQVEADAEAKGEMAEAKNFLRSLAPEGNEPAEKINVKATTDWGAPGNPQGKTLGELFTASDAYGDFVGRYGKNGIIPNAVKGVQSNPFQVDAKALVTGASSTSGGAFVMNDRYGQTTDLIGQRELTIADLVTKGSTTSDTVEYVRVTAKTNSAATVAEATTAAAGAISGASPGPYAVATPSGTKPESGLTLEVVSTTVKTIAHWIPITKRAASDAAQVRTLIDSFLRYGLDEELEDQILNGGGTGEDFTGILQSSPQTVGSAGTDIDAIVAAIAAVRVTGRRKPNALVIHPNDWYSTGFLLAKDSQNNYLLANPGAGVDQLNQLWGLRVVVSEAMTENTALVGDFRWSVLWNREGASVLVSDQHSDFFTRNLLAILAERRDAFGVLDNQAFCTVTAV